MLFLTKRTMVTVLALGTLLSVNARMFAATPSVSGREVVAVLAGVAAAYEGYREVSQAKNETKSNLARAHDTVATTWQSLLNAVTSKKGLVAVAGALGVYAVAKHGTNVTNAPVVQTVLSYITPKSGAAS